ncbi:hypothetical protein K488DRAFT_68407 [Vararia minispora EC-137]|uniref:Uncharacterized protein n=1 Tax=Vararia minispora EC-137 TaxID=1314806 RepID=A0ACB8QUZ8_9AGAM|nr:hypothetical protein K488DRAFT_68407 [Vararia minispora EC-137]
MGARGRVGRPAGDVGVEMGVGRGNGLLGGSAVARRRVTDWTECEDRWWRCSGWCAEGGNSAGWRGSVADRPGRVVAVTVGGPVARGSGSGCGARRRSSTMERERAGSWRMPYLGLGGRGCSRPLPLSWPGEAVRRLEGSRGGELIGASSFHPRGTEMAEILGITGSGEGWAARPTSESWERSGGRVGETGSGRPPLVTLFPRGRELGESWDELEDSSDGGGDSTAWTVLRGGRLRLQYGTNLVGDVDRLSGMCGDVMPGAAAADGAVGAIAGLAARSGWAAGTAGGRPPAGWGSGLRFGDEAEAACGDSGCWGGLGRRGGGDTGAGVGSGVGRGDRKVLLAWATATPGGFWLTAGGTMPPPAPLHTPGVGSGLRDGTAYVGLPAGGWMGYWAGYWGLGADIWPGGPPAYANGANGIGGDWAWAGAGAGAGAGWCHGPGWCGSGRACGWAGCGGICRAAGAAATVTATPSALSTSYRQNGPCGAGLYAILASSSSSTSVEAKEQEPNYSQPARPACPLR